MRKRRAERAAQYESPAYRSLQRRLASNLRRLRAERNWTQEESAHRAQMAVQLYQRIEGAAANVTLTTLARLCYGFAVDIRGLWGSPSKARSAR